MGLFTRTKAAPTQLSEQQAAEWLGLEGRVIFRDTPGIVGMYCTNVDLEPGWYACTLHNKGNQVSVVVGGKPVATLDRNCLGDAVEVLRASGGREARAILQPRPAGRKTASVYARA